MLLQFLDQRAPKSSVFNQFITFVVAIVFVLNVVMISYLRQEAGAARSPDYSKHKPAFKTNQLKQTEIKFIKTLLRVSSLFYCSSRTQVSIYRTTRCSSLIHKRERLYKINKIKLKPAGAHQPSDKLRFLKILFKRSQEAKFLVKFCRATTKN